MLKNSHLKKALLFILAPLLITILFQNCGKFEGQSLSSESLLLPSIFDVPIEPGTGLITNDNVPYQDPIESISASFYELNGNTCHIGAQGDLYCEGQNANFEVGNGSNSPVTKPTLVLSGPITKIVTSSSNSSLCAIKQGSLFCWGKAFERVLPGELYKRPQLILSGGVRDATINNSGIYVHVGSNLLFGGRSYSGNLNSWLSPIAANVDKLLTSQRGQTCFLSNAEVFCLKVIDINAGTVIAEATGLKNILRFWNMGNGINCGADGISLKCSYLDQAEKVILEGDVTQFFAGNQWLCAIVNKELQCWGNDKLGLLNTSNPNLNYSAYTDLSSFVRGAIASPFRDAPTTLYSGDISKVQLFSGSLLSENSNNINPTVICLTENRDLKCLGANIYGFFGSDLLSIEKNLKTVASGVIDFWRSNNSICIKGIRDIRCNTPDIPNSDWQPLGDIENISSLNVTNRPHCFVDKKDGSVYCNSLSQVSASYSSGHRFEKYIESGVTQISGHPQKGPSPSATIYCYLIQAETLKKCSSDFTGTTLVDAGEPLLTNVQKMSVTTSMIYLLSGRKILGARLSNFNAGNYALVELAGDFTQLEGKAAFRSDLKVVELDDFANPGIRSVFSSADFSDKSLIQTTPNANVYTLNESKLYIGSFVFDKPVSKFIGGYTDCLISEGKVFCNIKNSADATRALLNPSVLPGWTEVAVGPFKDFRIVSVNTQSALCGLQNNDLVCKGQLGDMALDDWTRVRGGVAELHFANTSGELIIRNTSGQLESFGRTAVEIGFSPFQLVRNL